MGSDNKNHITGVGDFPKLDEWLTKHHARNMWDVRPARDRKRFDPVVQGWLVNGRIAIICLYPPNPNTGSRGGWGIFTEAGDYTLDMTETLAEAEKRLGLKEGA